MNPSTSNQPHAQKNKKQEYHSPQLESAGTLKDLTQGAGSIGGDGIPCQGTTSPEQCW